MSITIRYVGSSGNSYDLKSDGFKIVKGDFHKYTWSPDTTSRQYGVKIARFTKSAISYSTTLAVRGSYAFRRDTLEALHADFETDILNMSPGRIYWGSCYIECYITSNDTSPESDNRWTQNKVTIYCPYPFWIEETEIEIGKLTESTTTDTDKGYDDGYAYSYSYAASQTIKHVTLSHYGLATYKLVASGPASYISVSIDGTLRTVNYAIAEGETLTIDTRPNLDSDKRIYVTASDGTMTNVFDYRDPDSGIFDKIQPGILAVDYSRAYPITLTLYAERSEPKHG